MKKKVFLVAGAVLFAAAVSAIVYVNNERNSMDELFNANVEALASGEHGSYTKCYNTIKAHKTENVMYCGTCTVLPGMWRSGMSFCMK